MEMKQQGWSVTVQKEYFSVSDQLDLILYQKGFAFRIKLK